MFDPKLMPPLPAMPKGHEVRHIPGEPGYAVDTLGRPWSCRYIGYRGGNADNWRLMTPTPNVRPKHPPYLIVCFTGIRTQYVSVLVLRTFSGRRPFGKVVQYRDGDVANCRLENLFWGETASITINKKIIRTIRREYWPGACGYGYVALGKKHGLSASSVRNIIKCRYKSGRPSPRYQSVS